MIKIIEKDIVERISPLEQLLGEDNIKRLQDGITDIILKQIKNDFEDCSEYILNPDDIMEFAERCKEKAFLNIETEIIKNIEMNMKSSLISDKQASIPWERIV